MGKINKTEKGKKKNSALIEGKYSYNVNNHIDMPSTSLLISFTSLMIEFCKGGHHIGQIIKAVGQIKLTAENQHSLQIWDFTNIKYEYKPAIKGQDGSLCTINMQHTINCKIRITCSGRPHSSLKVQYQHILDQLVLSSPKSKTLC